MHSFALENNAINKRGQMSGMWVYSISIYTTIILVVDLKIALHTKYWTILSICVLLGTSLLIYIAYVFISSQIDDFEVYQSSDIVFSVANVYLI